MSNTLLKPEPAVTQTSAKIPEAEFIDLAQIWSTIKRYRMIVSICILLGIAGAVVLWSIFPKKWHATAILQIGQMPINTQGFQIALIEPPAQTVERLNQRDLEDKALVSVGLPTQDEENKSILLFRKSLKGTVVKNTNFVEISLAAYSREEGKKFLNAVILSLIAAHNQRMAPALKNINAQAQTNAAELNEAKAQRSRLQGTLKTIGESPASPFAPHVVALDLLAKQDEQIHILTVERTVLADILLSSNTYPTSVIDNIYVPNNAYFPKLSLFLALGIFTGAILGGMLALLADRREKSRVK
ncbi:Wzz/FepE/Etk N-terminal domain-containing protein [Glaciimonas immobilis]|uniref:Uncharacterized protein involved in exopolysaccharide biosynthesis n=1 Tax=Glaciimonas immobilis TaxID=728004 RepID=A0A840RU69_9BURK|nr:Wzz/FepE/Etk N-terminal domain-containing protein [Glaciimonas immobilis]KAF3999944.1 hypothetical protein HAV38_01855 [Glaciimonas immobilis]MBB5200446.1 uncharacterized protein involved in exopolysaccharide biosynthesis [Glaciimonas immobilis]